MHAHRSRRAMAGDLTWAGAAHRRSACSRHPSRTRPIPPGGPGGRQFPGHAGRRGCGARRGVTMTLQFFPVTIGSYEHWETLTVERESQTVEELLADFGGEPARWNAPDARDSDLVEGRLRQ